MSRRIRRVTGAPFGWCSTGHHDRCRRSYETANQVLRICGCRRTDCPCNTNPRGEASD